MTKLIIPEGKICDNCEQKDDGINYRLAVHVNDNMGFMPPTYQCDECAEEAYDNYMDSYYNV